MKLEDIKGEKLRKQNFEKNYQFGDKTQKLLQNRVS